jgi:hypothetical protein
MLQFVFCVLMLLPLVALPVGVFFASKLLGLLIGMVSLVLAVPLVLAAVAHLDLHRAKSRYGLSEDELDEFSRLVPRLARKPEYARMRSRDMRRSTKDAAAEIIRLRRSEPGLHSSDDELPRRARGNRSRDRRRGTST